MKFWYEQQFIDQWNPEYNMSRNAEVPTKRGEHLSSEHKDAIRIGHLGLTHTKESKIKIGLSGLGRTYSPETHALWSKQRMGHEKCAKFHMGLISPTGEIFRNIFNMSKFCREHGLTKSRVSSLELGKQTQTKGWTLLSV